MSPEPHEPDDDITGRAYDARLARRLGRYLRPHARLASLSFAFILARTGLFLLSPFLLGLAVDRGIRAGDDRALLAIAAVYLAVEVLKQAVQFGDSYTLSILGQRIMYDLRLELFTKLESQSLSFFDRQPVGRLVTRVMNDVQALADLFSTGVAQAFADLLFVVGISAALLALDWRLALVALAVIPPLAVATFAINRRMRGSFRAVRRLLARINATLAENLAGVRVVQLFNREGENARRFGVVNDDHKVEQLRSVHWQGIYSAAVTILSSSAIALVLWYGGGRALEEKIALGALVAAIAYVQNLFAPIRDLADKYALFQAAMASAERIFKLLDAEVEVRPPAEPAAPLATPLRGEVEFQDVWFSYRPGEHALKGVSFKVAAGETVAIVGHTGAGKTTVVNLLGRFYDVTRGAVLVDGRDVRTLPFGDLRRAVGMVLQDVFIFAGTVLDNVRLGEPSIPEEQVVRAARAVEAHRFIERLPQAYREEMRERGATLSVGQKQLLSFARALAFDPKVLVLDEATASIDPETERTVQAAIRTLTHGRTSIVIAHRLATVRDADRVLVLHKGELREEGTPKALLARRGIYWKLWQLQARAAGAGAGAGAGAPSHP